MMAHFKSGLVTMIRACGAHTGVLFAILLTVAWTFPANAGIKYWDNPAFRAFDADDYAPDAVWHFDAIRNVGMDQPHSTTTTTWKNLGSSGSNNDIWVRYLNLAGNGWGNSSAPASLGIVNGRNLGSWTENGFVLTGDSEFRASGSAASINTGTDYTLQMLVDATVAEQIYSKPYFMSVEKNVFSFFLEKSSGKLYWNTQTTTTADHPYLTVSSIGYLTAILNGTDNTATFFSGTEVPTSGNGFRSFNSVVGRNESGYCIGGQTSADASMVGTLHSYRYYKRVLTREELVWNRVVDEARFFGRRAALPVTNVVVASTFPRIGGAEPVGHYAIDAGGHTFTAPAATNFAGRAYTCTGYSLETWDGTAWSAPEAHDGEFSYTLADTTALVRLTWRWVGGEGLVTYDMDDYVWDGLLWFYDGIRNVGRELPHDSNSLNWANLGSLGSANDLFLQQLKASQNAFETSTRLAPAGEIDPGVWTDTGFVFRGYSRFRSTGPFPAESNLTVQTLVDVNTYVIPYDPSYLMSISPDRFSFRLGKTSGDVIWRLPSITNDVHYNLSSHQYDYLTAILNGTEKTATLFSGTNAPTSGVGFLSFESMPLWGDNAYCIGSTSGGNQIAGTLKVLRFYGRALSNEEVARNRVVDDFRYFGRSPVTNVLVTTTYPYLQGNEKAAAYEVVGSYTFTAPASITAKGITYTNDGYTVELWNSSDNTWGSSTVHTGTSYAYTETAGKVRLTWMWKPVHGVRTAADYSFDDYSQAGLVWNYDGIRNVGADLLHSTNTTTWVNIGSGGAPFNLLRTKLDSAHDPGVWTKDGYEFRGYTRFKSGANTGLFKSFTYQVLMDASADNQINNNGFPMSVMFDYFALALHQPSGDSLSGALFWTAQTSSATLSLLNDSLTYDYATAIFDYDAKTAAFFSGTEPPTSGTGFHQFNTVSSRKTTGFGLGCTATTTDAFTGVVKSFRYYDRVLTQEELVRNRNVDAARYFGELGVTNVFVVPSGGVQTETGACKVEGTWTFTAETVQKLSGTIVPAVRHSVETLVDGEWTGLTWHNGATYTYTEGSDPATVRLTWYGYPDGTLISIR